MRNGTEQPSIKGLTLLFAQIVLVIEEQATNRMIYAKIATSLSNQVQVHDFEKPTQASLWLKTNSVIAHLGHGCSAKVKVVDAILGG